MAKEKTRSNAELRKQREMIDGQVNAVGRVRRGVGIVLFLLFSLGSLNRAPDDSLRKESKEHRIGYKLGGVVAFLIPIGLYWWGHSARKRARKELDAPIPGETATETESASPTPS